MGCPKGKRGLLIASPMNVSKPQFRWQRKYHRIGLILLISLIHAGFYIFLVPPWQHYDEPTHFEYAWLIANQEKLPQPDSFDSNMRREVAASMVEHEFFDTLAPPNLLLEKTWIGISQTSDQPFYYLAAAIPLWFLKGSDITVQLYAGRAVSLCMFLLTILIAYRLTIEIFPKNEPLQWLIPASIALTPAFVDIMTAINNDVGATLIFSVFLLSGTRLITRGVTLIRILVFSLMTVGCYYTKTTVLVAIPLAALMLLLTMFQAKFPWNRIAFPMILLCLTFSGFFLFSWEDAAFWYRSQLSVQQTVSTRNSTGEGHPDKYSLQIQFAPGDKHELSLIQPLNSQTTNMLSGKNYTLGAWIWASEPVQAQMPTLSIDGKTSFQPIQLEQSPSFFASTGKIPANPKRINLLLDPLTQTFDHPVFIYFDHIVLAEGRYPLDKIPTLSNDSTSGTWGDKTFVNIIRNPSAEEGWLTFKPHLLFQFRTQTTIPFYALPAMQDFQLTYDTYRNTAKNLFESYWARFGWNHVSLPQIWYLILQWFTLIGVGGTIVGLIRQGTKRDVRFALLTTWFVICTFLIWMAALARQTLPFWDANPFTPSARYAYPVIIPTTMIIFTGWHYLAALFPKTKFLAFIPIVFLIILDITSLVVIFRFYHPG